LLTSAPVLVLGLVAIPGALVVGRLGARRTVAIGLALLATGGALRSAVPAAISLFAFTAVMAVGIAITQPALPTLVQRWFPDHVGRATGIYTNGLFVGEVTAAVITLPILLDRLGLGWQGALAAWAIPATAGLAAWLLFAPQARRSDAGTPDRWLPDIRSGRAWRLGLLMGGASLIYFGMNTWIPDTLAVRGGRGMTTATLGLLNLMQLPVSAALAVAGDALIGRRWPYVGAGMLSAVGVLGYVLAPPASAPVWAGLLGVGSSLIFILNLGLPPLTAAPHEVAGVTAFMLATGYATAFFGPAVGGLAWDASGIWQLALAPIGLACLTTIGLGATLPLPRLGPGRREAFESA
jgi:CP family cyanate transporter-like MFS transporter